MKRIRKHAYEYPAAVDREMGDELIGERGLGLNGDFLEEGSKKSRSVEKEKTRLQQMV